MGASIFIKGVREQKNDDIEQMFNLARHCRDLKVDYPKQVKEFFGDVIHLKCFPIDYDEVLERMLEGDIGSAVTGDVEYGNGAVIDLTKLPPGIKQIRVFMQA